MNWNGLPPHLEHTRAPAVQDMIDGVDRRRDEYQAYKAEHEKAQTEYESRHLAGAGERTLHNG